MHRWLSDASPRNPGPRPSTILSFFALVVMPLVAGSCDQKREDPVGPALQPVGDSAVAGFQESEPVDFYYFKGPDSEERIPASRDRSTITITVEPAADLDSLQLALENLGLAVGSIDPSFVRGRWQLTFPAAPDPVADRRLAVVRSMPGVKAANFRILLPDGPADLSGQLAVEFNGGVSREEVDEIRASVGLELALPPVVGHGNHWRFWLPQDADPLTVAARVHEHPSVDWAELEWVGPMDLDSPSDPLFQYQILPLKLEHEIRD